MERLKKISAIGTTKLQCPICKGTKFCFQENEIPELESMTCCDECGAMGQAETFAAASALDEVVQEVLARAKRK